jgi:transposase InsO family protein
MPWKEVCPMEERMRFVVRLENGERMTDLCREFGISRKTGYKFLDRFKQLSLVGLNDQSRAPIEIPHRTPPEVEDLIVSFRLEHPTWGARKLVAALETKHPGIKLPVHSTVSTILDKHGLVKHRTRREKHDAVYSPVSHANEPHDVLCIDYKGQFRLGDGKLCYPLTLTDACSRFILACEAFHCIDGGDVRRTLEVVFHDHGVPSAMRSDNGAPFASRGLWGWSVLSVWLLKLGIRLERIEPGCPQQNGRHERMHRTLKEETTRPAAANLLQQQERFDRFVEVFNVQRPHEALEQKTPASRYRRSSRAYPSSPADPSYPLHDLVVGVDSVGHIRLPGAGKSQRNFFITAALRGERVGLRELDDKRWLVSFLAFDLGELDVSERRFKPYAPPTA